MYAVSRFSERRRRKHEKGGEREGERTDSLNVVSARGLEKSSKEKTVRYSSGRDESENHNTDSNMSTATNCCNDGHLFTNDVSGVSRGTATNIGFDTVSTDNPRPRKDRLTKAGDKEVNEWGRGSPGILRKVLSNWWKKANRFESIYDQQQMESSLTFFHSTDRYEDEGIYSPRSPATTTGDVTSKSTNTHQHRNHCNAAIIRSASNSRPAYDHERMGSSRYGGGVGIGNVGGAKYMARYPLRFVNVFEERSFQKYLEEMMASRIVIIGLVLLLVSAIYDIPGIIYFSERINLYF